MVETVKSKANRRSVTKKVATKVHPRSGNPPKGGLVRGHWVSKNELVLVQEKLREAQETLDAIRSGEVDAVVVSGANGSQIYSLTSAEQPYRVYVERMQEGAVTISADGMILYCNQRFAQMLSQPLERVISSGIRSHLPEEAWETIARVLQESEEAAKLECLLQRADGAAVPVHLTANSLPLGDQAVICLVVTDLTEQKCQEQLRLAKEVAERASEAKDSFLAVLSHELRTPLTPALMSLISLEQDEQLPDRIVNELSMIRRNIELETRLIDDLLDITRIAHGKLELHKVPTDIHTVLSRAIETCRPSIDAKQQQLNLKLKARSTETNADAVRLQQVLWNIIRNAVKFTPTRGVITVSTKNLPGQKLQLEVQDTGIGFEPGNGARLFQAFEQSGRDITRKFGGLGLGLAISRSLVEAHGGQILGESKGTNQGATFTLILPLQRPPALPRGSGPQGNSAAAFKPRRILLVEDHADTLASLQRLLGRAGHEIISAGSALEALSIAAENSFDVIISDLGLPDLSGNDLMRQLRDRYGLRGIAVSGYGMEQDIADSRAAGFVHHLTKPIQVDLLRQLIESVATGQK